MLDKIKEHWFVALVIVCAIVVSATWGVLSALVVGPLREQNLYLRDRVDEMLASQPSDQSSAVLPRTTLSIGQTAATLDEACTIGLESIHSDTADMVMIAGSKPPSRAPMVSGDSWQTSVPGAWYYFFILDVGPNTAVVSGYRVGEPAGG